MTTGGFNGRLDPLPLGGWDSFAVEHGKWHLNVVLRLGKFPLYRTAASTSLQESSPACRWRSPLPDRCMLME